MNAAVVDASVAVMWVVPEAGSEQARHLLAEATVLHAPAHWTTEATAMLWAKRAVHGLMSRSEAEARIKWLLALPMKEATVRELVPAAIGAAFDLRTTVYDALYLALAERVAAPLVAADRKLLSKIVQNPRWSSRAMWVGTLPG